jgi:tRNA-dihydrouridine synthase B
MQIGPYTLSSNVLSAPMAGVSDLPYRLLCRRYGAGLAISEMVASDPSLRTTRKSLLRCNHSGESEPRSVQIVGTDPIVMAEAARYNVDLGAQIIDINMGCPAKKVCAVAAGSALMRDEPLVANILAAVVAAVPVPVTLKTRTGWDRDHSNVTNIARIAQEAGIAALTVHGRSRACGYAGDVDYDIIRQVKGSVTIPVIANGDITTPEMAVDVLNRTGADGIMIGRGAQGHPWLFAQINSLLNDGNALADPSISEIEAVVLEHVHALHAFYGERQGVRIARKHVGWYLSQFNTWKEAKPTLNRAPDAAAQIHLIKQFFSAQQMDLWIDAA